MIGVFVAVLDDNVGVGERPVAGAARVACRRTPQCLPVELRMHRGASLENYTHLKAFFEGAGLTAAQSEFRGFDSKRLKSLILKNPFDLQKSRTREFRGSLQRMRNIEDSMAERSNWR